MLLRRPTVTSSAWTRQTRCLWLLHTAPTETITEVDLSAFNCIRITDVQLTIDSHVPRCAPTQLGRRYSHKFPSRNAVAPLAGYSKFDGRPRNVTRQPTAQPHSPKETVSTRVRSTWDPERFAIEMTAKPKSPVTPAKTKENNNNKLPIPEETDRPSSSHPKVHTIAPTNPNRNLACRRTPHRPTSPVCFNPHSNPTWLGPIRLVFA